MTSFNITFKCELCIGKFHNTSGIAFLEMDYFLRVSEDPRAEVINYPVKNYQGSFHVAGVQETLTRIRLIVAEKGIQDELALKILKNFLC